MATVVQILVDGILACYEWFMQIVDATGAAKIIVGFISVCLSARFIVYPIVGGAAFRSGSDLSKKDLSNKTYSGSSSQTPTSYSYSFKIK